MAVSVLFLQQVSLVQKEDKRDVCKGRVVDKCGKNVTGLENSVGFSVFQQDLVVLADGGQEEDAVDGFEALVPFLALKSLTTWKQRSKLWSVAESRENFQLERR